MPRSWRITEQVLIFITMMPVIPEGSNLIVQLQTELRLLARSAAITIFVVFGILGSWAVFASLSGAVIASGVMKIEDSVKVAQHPDGGVVRHLLVREGQQVQRGDPIVELEDVEANSIFRTVRDQLDGELARSARLTGEIQGSTVIEFPPELTDRAKDPKVRVILRTEEEHFSARQHMYRQQQARLREQRKALHTEIESLDRQVKAAEKSLGYLHTQEKMADELLAKGFVSEARVLDSRRTTAEKEEKHHEFKSLRAQARQKLADVELRLDSVVSNRMTENQRDLADAQNKIFTLQERLRPAADSLRKRIVKSPVTGRVNNMRIHTVGGVVAPREPIAEIVPEQSALVAEVRVNPPDIEHIKEGLEANVELTGSNRRTTPLLKGKVTFVSPDLNTDPANPQIRYFISYIQVTDTLPPGISLKSGMPVTAYITVRERSPLSLWLDPLIGAMRKSGREP